MKKYFISMLALAALAACSKSEESQVANPDNGALVPITLNAGIQATTVTKAPITDTKFTTVGDVFAVTAYKKEIPTDNWTGAAFDAKVVECTNVDGTISFKDAQYYPANGDNLYFYAWSLPAQYTAGAADKAPFVTYMINGDLDVMAAQITTGFNKESGTNPEFKFEHVLKQINFAVKSDGTSTLGHKVTKIEIKDVNTTLEMNVMDGTITSSAPTAIDAMSGKDPITLTADAQDAGKPVMFEPGKTFTLKITMEDNTVYDDVAITLDDAGFGGTSYKVTLTFTGSKITPTATIKGWEPGAPVEKPVK